MGRNNGPTKQEWHKSYECLSPGDANQMLLVGVQRTRHHAHTRPMTIRHYGDHLAQTVYQYIRIIGGEFDLVRQEGVWLVPLVMVVMMATMTGSLLAIAQAAGRIDEKTFVTSVVLMVIFVGFIGARIAVNAARSARALRELRAQARMRMPEWLVE